MWLKDRIYYLKGPSLDPDLHKPVGKEIFEIFFKKLNIDTVLDNISKTLIIFV